MIDFRVRSVIALQGLDLTLPSGDRKCVIDCDRENKLYHFPYQFLSSFCFGKSCGALVYRFYRKMRMYLLLPFRWISTDLRLSENVGLIIGRAERVAFRQRTKERGSTRNPCDEVATSLSTQVKYHNGECRYITLPKAIYHISLCEIYHYERSVINAHKKYCNTHKSYRKRTRSH